MTGSLYRAGGWKPPANRTTARPYRRKDPRETTPENDWWKREQKTRAEQDAITAERKARKAREIQIPAKRT